MATNQNWGPARGGGFLRILGIIYLVKIIRRRRARQRAVAESGETRARSE
jgi:hypothetical protein